MGEAQEKPSEDANAAKAFEQSKSVVQKPDFDVQAIIARARSVLSDPKGVWSEIKVEQSSIKDVYMNYLLVMAAIPAVCGFIGGVVFGVGIPGVGTVRTGLFAGLFSGIVSYAVALAGVYIAALVVEFLAPQFGGKADRTRAFKLLAYSYTAAYVGGILGLVPILSLLGIVFGFYSLYTYYQGIPAMLDVPQKNQLPFAVVSIIGIVVVMIVVGGIAAIIA